MKYYYAIDGDDIGKELERYVLEDNINEVELLSKDIKDKLFKIENYLVSCDAKTIFCSGDSILSYSDNLIDIPEELIFYDKVSFSVGIGDSPSFALLALKKAKGLGKKRIESFIGNVK